MSAFKAYGVGVTSNLTFDDLDELSDLQETGNIIHVNVQRVPRIEKDPGIALRPCTAQGRDVHIVFHESYVAVQVELLLCFELWLSSNHIECRALNEFPDRTLQYWVLQQILPLFLLLNGSTEFLHGMAVSSLPSQKSQEGQPPTTSMAFLGASYVGKSTLLSYFLSQGHALITDDHLALSRLKYEEAIPAIPFYRSFRSVESLGKRADVFFKRPSRLQRLYLLQPALKTAEVRSEKLTGIEAVAELFPNIHYSLHNLRKPDLFPIVEDRFRGLASLIRAVPLARLHVPRDLSRLPEVYEFIQEDLAS